MKLKKRLAGFLAVVVIFLIGVLLLDILYIKQRESNDEDRNITKLNEDDTIVFKEKTKEITPVFSNNRLTEANVNRVDGVSWKPEAPVKLEDLRYVEVTYWGFDDKPHLGELVVHKKVSNDILEIFKGLYEAKFPIDKIKLVDEYNADDNLSMDDNNTSSFCFRTVAGTNKLSEHSYGLAIDINPIQNPYIKGDIVLPVEGKNYIDRSNIRKGMIVKDDICYKTFIDRGWVWGGEWKTLKDYQHFEKKIDIE